MSSRIATCNPLKTTIAKPAAALLALAWLCIPGRLAARENVYDVLGKALGPIANVFAVDDSGQPGVHALVLDAHLLTASKLPPQLQGQAIHVAIQTPDAILVQAPIAGQKLTVCRDGDALWATPGSNVEPLLRQALASASPGKKKKKHKNEEAAILGPLAVPVTQKEMVFLPVLFQATDAGDETVAGKQCMVMDVELMPQMEKSMHAEGWTAKLWVGPDYGIVQIALMGPDWTGTAAIDKLDFPAGLPDATFQPQGTDVLKLTAEQFLRLIGAVGRE